MIGADTTFLVKLELREASQHVAARDVLSWEILMPGMPLASSPQVLAQ